MYKQAACRCIRIDRNRNTIVMLGPEELPAGHSCDHCSPKKHRVPRDAPASAKVQLTKVESKATTPRPAPQYIRINQNRNIVTLVDDIELGDDHRVVCCDGVQEAFEVSSTTVPQMVRRKAKAPSAYFGKTLERYLEEARINDEDRMFSAMSTGQMVRSSTAANERLRSSLAVLGGGSGKAHVRATSFSTTEDPEPTRRRSSQRQRKSSGKGRTRHRLRLNQNRNTVEILDPSELPAERRTRALSVSRTTKSWSGQKCVRFDRNRNSMVLVDPSELGPNHSCEHCETNLLTKKTRKTTSIRAML